MGRVPIHGLSARAAGAGALATLVVVLVVSFSARGARAQDTPIDTSHASPTTSSDTVTPPAATNDRDADDAAARMHPPPGSADALAQHDAAVVTGTASEDEQATPARNAPGTRRIMFTSNARYDDVRAVRTSRSGGGTRTYTCDTPCELQLPHGQYRLHFTHAGEEGQLHVGAYPMLVEANRGSIGELVVGTMVTIGGAIVLAISLLTGEGTCFTTESSCDIVHGPFALGAAAFAMAAGLFLMFDSQGGIDVTAMDL